MRIMNITEDMYDELSATLTNFEDDEDNMSDGEWLDMFYDLCVKIQNNIANTPDSY